MIMSRGFYVSEKEATEIVEKMDKNKDGKVTQQEFIDAVMAKDKFSKFLTSNVVDLFT